ncbi:Cyanophycin synthetase [Bremerella volcania]|uniref:Cyanophycin synthetase n=1 Tax=Bremerella volcania TaxID=2527984 RepID=A0A518C941_9BACT|nr:cyanophycin synthetase [Bremerella volcania]QDU75747.1 Cyanophycin synthetase [Bremerella volcania]
MWNHLDLHARSLWTLARTKLAARRGIGKAMQRQRDEFYSHAWEQAAAQIGASFDHLEGGLYEIRRHGQSTRVWKNYTPHDDPGTLRLAGNKPLVLQKLKQVAPQSPWKTFTIASLDTARKLLDGSPHVVKPARNTGAGSGVTTGVRTLSDLRTSAAIASAFDSTLLIEKQIAGANYRLLFLYGELLEVVRRDPPAIQGDGRSSIRQLVAAENALRREQGWRRAQTMLTVDDDMRRTLSSSGLTLRSVPPADQPVTLKTVINENQAAENEVVDDLCPEIVASCRDCARELGIQLAGVDIITTDPSVPLEQSGGVVLEVNTTPGFYHHLDCDELKCRVAPAILDAALRQSNSSLKSQLNEKWEVAN